MIVKTVRGCEHVFPSDQAAPTIYSWLKRCCSDEEKNKSQTSSNRWSEYRYKPGVPPWLLSPLINRDDEKELPMLLFLQTLCPLAKIITLLSDLLFFLLCSPCHWRWCSRSLPKNIILKVIWKICSNEWNLVWKKTIEGNKSPSF